MVCDNIITKDEVIKGGCLERDSGIKTCPNRYMTPSLGFFIERTNLTRCDSACMREYTSMDEEGGRVQNQRVGRVVFEIEEYLLLSLWEYTEDFPSKWG
jgi:hypothetical protein